MNWNSAKDRRSLYDYWHKIYEENMKKNEKLKLELNSSEVSKRVHSKQVFRKREKTIFCSEHKKNKIFLAIRQIINRGGDNGLRDASADGR